MFFGWFVPGYLEGFFGHGGCCVVVIGFFDNFFNGLWLGLWLVCGLVFARIVVGLGAQWLVCGGGVNERVVVV